MGSSVNDVHRVIVAEDDPLVAGALSWLLREQGYLVETVETRDDLFTRMSASVPDLVLLDSDVVHRDAGILSLIRSDEKWHDVRVIMTAPFAALEDSGTGLPWGVDDCVSKPFRVPELLGRVRTQLRASSQLRAARDAQQDTAAELQSVRGDAVNNRR